MSDIVSEKDDIKKFSHYEKKKIVYKIEQLKQKKHFVKLFKIINKETNNYTQNKNGIFININNLSQKTLEQINIFLLKLEEEDDIIDSTTSSIGYQPYSMDEFSDYKSYGPKLTNHEKNIIKRNRYEKNIKSESKPISIKKKIIKKKSIFD